MVCPVCQSSHHSPFDQDKTRSYFLCMSCSLVFVPRESCLAPESERARYESHHNSEHDPEYEKYLMKIVNAVTPYLSGHDSGLDFGCGRTKLLQKLFNRAHINMNSYDLYFYPSEDVLSEKYNFIILSEVIEHLNRPYEVMEKLAQLLHPGGLIFIKTKFYAAEVEIFKKWFYKRDLTHVQFFNQQSMEFLAKRLQFGGPVKMGEDLYLLKSSN